MKRSTTPWFRPVRFGIGAQPASREGYIAAIGVIFVIAVAHDLLDGVLSVLAIGAIIGAYMLLVSRRTSGGWRWRWGDLEPDR